MEIWFDRKHTGALRVVDTQRGIIHGSDPKEARWSVHFEALDARRMRVDFGTKRTHHGRRIMVAEYMRRKTELHWPDGNVWLRVRTDPRPVLQHLS